MKVDKKILERLQQLIDYSSEIERTRSYDDDKIVSEVSDWLSGIRLNKHIAAYDCVDIEKSNQWGVSCLQIIRKTSGVDSEYYVKFAKLFSLFTTKESYAAFRTALGVLKATKDDYENGYIFDTRTLIEAEIFDDLLEQSEHLLSQGYFQAAAVIAGCVLEDALRKLCIKNNIALSAKPKLDSMNSDLAKANIYNLLKQKQITALADLRNKAAHNQGGFTKEDVEDMIRNVRRFMEDYFS